MAIFISYSHADASFAERLANHLVDARAQVWIDRWELNVGDSLMRRIEEAVTRAFALVVVISRASVASEWCRKELTAGLVRELEERRVVVMPALLEDCDVPLFLRDKKYADFRTCFDDGFTDLLRAVASVTNDLRSRIERPKWHVDWAIDWGMDQDHVVYVLTFIEQALDKRFSCLSVIHVRGNTWSTARYHAYKAAGLSWVFRRIMLEMVADAAQERDARLVLKESFPQRQAFEIQDQKYGVVWEVLIECRVLGEDTGFDVQLDVAGLLGGAVAHVRTSTRNLTEDEEKRLQEVLATLKAK